MLGMSFANGIKLKQFIKVNKINQKPNKNMERF